MLVYMYALGTSQKSNVMIWPRIGSGPKEPLICDGVEGGGFYKSEPKSFRVFVETGMINRFHCVLTLSFSTSTSQPQP
jgi:hypothetical protein